MSGATTTALINISQCLLLLFLFFVSFALEDSSWMPFEFHCLLNSWNSSTWHLFNNSWGTKTGQGRLVFCRKRRYLGTKGQLRSAGIWSDACESTSGHSLIFVNRVAAAGQASVRCLAVDEDPEGTEHVWVIWCSRCAFHRHTLTDPSRSKTKACSVLFLLRHEHEKFANLLALVGWHQTKCECVSQLSHWAYHWLV